MGIKCFENISSVARLWYYFQILNMLGNMSRFINNACLINSNFSAVGELERLHGNCQIVVEK